jgi:hypothetical protein
MLACKTAELTALYSPNGQSPPAAGAMIELPQAERCGKMQADALRKLLKQQPLNSAKPFLHEHPH